MTLREYCRIVSLIIGIITLILPYTLASETPDTTDMPKLQVQDKVLSVAPVTTDPLTKHENPAIEEKLTERGNPALVAEYEAQPASLKTEFLDCTKLSYPRTVDELVETGSLREAEDSVETNVLIRMTEGNKDEKLAPIFETDPHPNDIQQLGSADCGFLAPLLSIIVQNPNHIKKIMYDDPVDNVVYVKFYNPDYQRNEFGVISTTEIATPIYKLIKERDLTFFMLPKFVTQQSKLWVHLLERAYDAHCQRNHWHLPSQYRKLHKHPRWGYKQLLNSNLLGYQHSMFCIDTADDLEKFILKQGSFQGGVALWGLVIVDVASENSADYIITDKDIPRKHWQESDENKNFLINGIILKTDRSNGETTAAQIPIDKSHLYAITNIELDTQNKLYSIYIENPGLFQEERGPRQFSITVTDVELKNIKLCLCGQVNKLSFRKCTFINDLTFPINYYPYNEHGIPLTHNRLAPGETVTLDIPRFPNNTDNHVLMLDDNYKLIKDFALNKDQLTFKSSEAIIKE